MKGKLDIAKMEAAFKRAAEKAVHGTPEERSGRFYLRGEGQGSPSAPGRSNKAPPIIKREA
jgi:hypothetical protein